MAVWKQARRDGGLPDRGSHNGKGNSAIFPIDVDMRTFYNFLGEVMHQGPSDFLERSTPWIIGLLGAGMLGLMAYAWAAAWW